MLKNRKSKYNNVLLNNLGKKFMPCSNRILRLAETGICTALIAWTASAAAQTAKAPAEPAPSDASETVASKGFDDILVTARHREERLQDIPVAATAFTRNDIERYQTQSFSQVAAQAPSLNLGNTGSVGGGVVNLRGIGSPSSGTTIDQAVAFNIDGVQVSQANVLRLGLHDLDRIEILKGPQALFYGKNSPAGVISILSQGPGHVLEPDSKVYQARQ